MKNTLLYLLGAVALILLFFTRKDGGTMSAQGAKDSPLLVLPTSAPRNVYVPTGSNLKAYDDSVSQYLGFASYGLGTVTNLADKVAGWFSSPPAVTVQDYLPYYSPGVADYNYSGMLGSRDFSID